MTQYNFDNIIDRHGTSAVKIDRLDAVFGRHDLRYGLPTSTSRYAPK